MRLLCLLQFICLAICHPSRTRDWAHHGAPMFADLTVREMKAVRSYLHSIPELDLSTAQSLNLKKNSILLIELHLPRKHEALRALDRGQAKPPREARVVVQFANQAKPNITEYIVSPLPSPKSHRVKTFKGDRHPLFESRPITKSEYTHITEALVKITTKAQKLLFDTTGGFSFSNCSNRCLTFSDIAPRGTGPGQRRTWIMLQKFVEGYFIHPVGFEVLLNHLDLDPQKWTVEKVWYNSRYFDSVEELVEKYDAGLVEKAKLPDHDDNDLYSTYIPRGYTSTPTEIHGPKFVEPQGARYHIDHNFVEYAGWSFAYRVRSSAGLQIFDLSFNGERIAYEISLQEAIAFYAGDTPAAMQTKYIDAGWAMGTSTYELAPGIDCPEIAKFVDLYHYYDTDKPIHFKNALCIFEMPTGIPLRRHFNSNFNGGYNFYGGLENTVLVLRTTSTVYNYDYIWDFYFYQNGVVEVKVSATGYIHATYFTPNGIQYGTKVYNYVLGNLHTHLIHYKVDLDIAGRQNSFESLDLKFVNFTNPWSPEDFIVQSKLQRTQHKTERSAAFRFGKKFPRYVHFYNPNERNKWGHDKGYRIQFNSHAHSVLPRGWKEENGVNWSRYPLAVTRYKDDEVSSSSIYAQCNPWEPLVSFEDFIRNNEEIVNQDLVAWVTVGFLHVPHAEDIPNTATPGNSVGFFLRPFNFFNEDPSVTSKSTVIVRPGQAGQPKIQRWTPAVVGHCVTNKPFSYNGTYGGV
ncbi:amiloride-sensitive amine oxidase [copper-containing] [Thalassophryne amazonica]|uniref:amiloride-sensitive amine oxidase [copper-containing] n=1 Tax=Thalassophryne amazonica TaxID=390379 RepID=UPI0014719A81|nr:amiloride-sensitive amine oxidase [copper-containing] [Thalassophryne amazonica]XP_034028127.1 amiloride-sensitive amine oxidase [copper-containing] [Thalassophryne amazonica]